MQPDNRIVAIKAAVNSKYVCAENGGASSLIANRNVAQIWEKFELSFYEQGRVALKSLANGKYVCAENTGSLPLIANRDKVGPWELF
jgi:hypothetical protein